MKNLTSFLFLVLALSARCQKAFDFKATGKPFTITTSGKPLTVTPSVTYFTLQDSAWTSVGVYTTDKRLIRTLWNAVHMGPGRHTIYWDGLLDDSTAAPANLIYHAEVLTHNVQYTWEGAAIGNSSTGLTGDSLYVNSGAISNMAITNNTMYYAWGYAEGLPGNYKTGLSPIGKAHALFQRDPQKGGSQATQFTTADATAIYWGGYLSGGNNEYFVFATKVSDDSQLPFTGYATPLNSFGRLFTSIAVRNIAITGLAVQKNKNYLFVAREDSFYVFHKTTGQQVSAIAFVCSNLTIDPDDNLWLQTAGQIRKYTVNSDASLTYAGISIAMTTGAGMAVNPAGTLLGVCDKGETQQNVKFYSTANGTLVKMLGTTGGNNVTPYVSDYCFSFPLPREALPTNPNIAFQTDGSFWITDIGNARVQHYTASYTYINSIYSMPYHYFIYKNLSDSSRIYENYRQWKIDYSKPLQQCWKLEANWEHWLTSAVGNVDPFLKPYNYVTLQGHTFCKVKRAYNTENDQYTYLYELTDTGARNTGIILGPSRFINRNGDLTVSYQDVQRTLFTGLDGNNNPTWGASATTYTFPANSPGTSLLSSPSNPSNSMVTADGKYIYFNPGKDNSSDLSYHLAGLSKGKSDFDFKAAKGNSPSYGGDYPLDGTFENGNGTVNAARFCEVEGNHIIHNYNGEFWKGRQTNYFHHYYSNGLLINIFGSDRWQTDYIDHAPWSGGNALTGIIVPKGGMDSAFYFMYGDESAFGGISRAVVSNLQSIQVKSYEFTKVQPPADAGDLMYSLKAGTDLTAVTGWVYSEPLSDNWQVLIGYNTANKLDADQDITVYDAAHGAAADRYIERTVSAAATSASSWQLSLDIRMQFSALFGENGSDVELIDNKGNIIAQFYRTGYDPASFVGNGATLWQTEEKNIEPYNYKMSALKISGSSAGIRFSYAGRTVTALPLPGSDWQYPATFRARFRRPANEGAFRGVTFKNLEFVRN